MFKKLLNIAIVGVLFASCSEDVMDRINKDEANPPAATVSAKFQITDAITSTGYSTWGGAYAWYVSSYTEQIFGTGNNQLMKAEIRQRSETAASSTFDNTWNATYSNLNNLKQIIEKCGDGGLNAGQKDILGMAQVLWALNAEALTDLHGDIPYSEALNLGIKAPALDKQEDIYKDLLAKVDAAIANLNEAKDAKMNFAGAQDLLYKGDLSQWLGLAHATKARLLMNTLYRNPSVLADVVKEGEAALEAGFDGAQLGFFNGVNLDNSWTAFNWSRQYSGACKTVVDYMAERNDPRVDVYAANMYAKATGAVAYAPAGDAELAQSTETVGYPVWLDNGAAKLHIFSIAELHFIIAEAKARLGQDAKANFEAAVKAAFADYAESAEYPELADMADDYIAAISNVDLKEIMIQKYIAQARDEQIQTYNDIRRCKAMGEEFIKLQNPNNNKEGKNQWPFRLAYGNSDVISNPNVAAAFGSGNDAGNYLFTEPVWIFGGNR